MGLKGSARHLCDGDTFDNNAFEEPVTVSPQTNLINAQTVFLFSLCFFSPDFTLISLFFYVPSFHGLSLEKKRREVNVISTNPKAKLISRINDSITH